MFIGHYGLAFAAKRLAPRSSLGTLIAAAQLLDLLWPILVLAGIERVRVDPGNTAFTPLDFESYPWSHSLLMVAIWSVAFGVVHAWWKRDPRTSVALGCLVLSHWVLDLVVHRPDLPLAPGAPKVGLGLWRSIPATLAVEAILFAGGVFLYARGTRPRDRVGRWAWWALVAFLGVVYVANVTGPPPPSASAIAGAGLGLWLFVPWGAWIDRHRGPRTGSESRGQAGLEAQAATER